MSLKIQLFDFGQCTELTGYNDIYEAVYTTAQDKGND